MTAKHAPGSRSCDGIGCYGATQKPWSWLVGCDVLGWLQHTYALWAGSEWATMQVIDLGQINVFLLKMFFNQLVSGLKKYSVGPQTR